jgi:pimeloyl-ACP methyl ester carboxylesterase
MGSKQKPLRSGLFVMLVACVLSALLFAAWKYYLRPPQSLGAQLEYVGKSSYGCWWLACDSTPGSTYYFATDMTADELSHYFRRTDCNTNDHSGLGGPDYAGIYIDCTLSGKTLEITYYNNRQWVDTYIGQKLADTIACFATSSREEGGVGKVVVVVHSMGGLATRWAATKAKNAKEVASDIGVVVTIGAPNTGSFLAVVGSWLACGDLPVTATLGNRTLTVNGNPLQVICQNWTALKAMQDYSSQINNLPWLPHSIPVEAIAGDVTIETPVFFSNISTNTGSDFVVDKNAALQGANRIGDLGGQVTVDCTVSSLSLNQGSFIYDRITNKPFFPVCWHSALPHNSAVEGDVLGVIKAFRESITLSSAVPSQFVGNWYVHGAQLSINADATGTMAWNQGPCGANYADMCTGNADLMFTVGSGEIRGSLTNVRFTSSNGQTVPTSSIDPHGTPQPGDSFTLSVANPNVLHITWLGSASTIWGNPNWCRNNYINASICGA